MTEELAERLISVLEGLKVDLYGIKVALILIWICVVVLMIVAVGKER